MNKTLETETILNILNTVIAECIYYNADTNVLHELDSIKHDIYTTHFDYQATLDRILRCSKIAHPQTTPVNS